MCYNVYVEVDSDYGGIIIMKIKQQKQIRKYLIEEFGEDKGNALFDKQEKILDELIKNTKNKSELLFTL